MFSQLFLFRYVCGILLPRIKKNWAAESLERRNINQNFTKSDKVNLFFSSNGDLETFKTFLWNWPIPLVVEESIIAWRLMSSSQGSFWQAIWPVGKQILNVVCILVRMCQSYRIWGQALHRVRVLKHNSVIVTVRIPSAEIHWRDLSFVHTRRRLCGITG
jgi:hypothetical protein